MYSHPAFVAGHASATAIGGFDEAGTELSSGISSSGFDAASTAARDDPRVRTDSFGYNIPS